MMYVLVSAVTAFMAWGIVWAVRWYSSRGTLIDIPNERSSHTRPTPRGGGLGIVMATLIGILFVVEPTPAVWAYITAGALIALVSWIDDVRSLSNRIRFGVHLLGAILVIMGGGWVEQVQLPLVGMITIGWVGIPLTILWLVGMTNIYNFMDGIDGIAGSQAVVAGGGWFLFGSLTNQPFVAWLGLLVAASSAGFLFHNWQPAGIFMGDVGSAFLGFTFGWMGIIATQSDPTLALPAVLLVWTFLFDAGYTIIRRLQRGENIFTAHRTHLYQRMVIAGQSHARITFLYALLALIGVGIAWIARQQEAWASIVFIPVLAFALWQTTRYIETRNYNSPS